MKPYFINLCDKLFEILEDKSTPMRIRKLRSDALLQLWRHVEKLERTTSIRKDLFDITFGEKSRVHHVSHNRQRDPRDIKTVYPEVEPRAMAHQSLSCRGRRTDLLGHVYIASQSRP